MSYRAVVHSETSFLVFTVIYDVLNVTVAEMNYSSSVKSSNKSTFLFIHIHLNTDTQPGHNTTQCFTDLRLNVLFNLHMKAKCKKNGIKM